MFLDLQPLGGKHVEVDGDRIVHVEKGGLDRYRQGVVQLLGLLFLEKALQFRIDDGFDDAIKHQRVTANIPSRLQPQPCMGTADGCHGIGIVRVEGTGGNSCPVFHLHAFGMLDMCFACKELRRFRHGARLRIKTVKRGVERACNDALHVRKVLPLLLAKPQKIKSFVELLIGFYLAMHV